MGFEPWNPHRGCLLIRSISFSSILMFQHPTLDKDCYIDQTECIDQCTYQSPSLTKVPSKYDQSPPPQLLSQVIRMSRVMPQTRVEVWDFRLSLLLEFLVSGYKLVKLRVCVVCHHNPRQTDSRGNEVPDV